MTTVVDQSSTHVSHSPNQHFGLPPLAISTTAGSPLKLSEWSFPSQLYDQLIQSFCEAKEDEFLLPNFSPLRCAGEPEVWPIDGSSFIEDDLTTEDSGSDAEDQSIAESDSDTDSSHSPSSVSLLSYPAASTPKIPPQSTRYAYDDTAIRTSAMQSVDLFSHPWTLEEASSSRREIRSHRAAYSNYARMEYMLWRVWTKKLKNLETVSPKSISERDDDVTWLYVPLMPAPASSISTDRAASQTTPSSKKSSSRSLSPKKSILKKRILPEPVLERTAPWPPTGNTQRFDRNLIPACPKKRVRFVSSSNPHLIAWRWLFNGCELNEE